MPKPPESPHRPLSATDWHVLVALADQDLHGYAIMKAVEGDSRGGVTAEIGSLYRILGRMMSDGLVADAEPPVDAPSQTPGRPRRYYRLTSQGRDVLARESARLVEAATIARARKLVPGSSQ